MMLSSQEAWKRSSCHSLVIFFLNMTLDIEVGVLQEYRAMQWATVNDTRVHPIWRKGRVIVLKD